MKGDLAALVAGERLVADQGEEEFGEGRHGAMIGAAVSATSSRIP